MLRCPQLTPDGSSNTGMNRSSPTPAAIDHIVAGTVDASGRSVATTILQKRLADPYENVVSADPSWVEMVMIGGDLRLP